MKEYIFLDALYIKILLLEINLFILFEYIFNKIVAKYNIFSLN